MAKTDFKSVDQYIATHPPEMRAVLRRVRATIRTAVPGAEEVISYQIPAYKLPGGAALYFAGWKQHYSLYPATRPIVAALGRALAGCEVSKGTIRFPLSRPVPVKLIARIAKLRAKEIAERAGGKGARSERTGRKRAGPKRSRPEPGTRRRQRTRPQRGRPSRAARKKR
jgi:uncharacterized protein YdhG (YjbR/CyaY superfamily)